MATTMEWRKLERFPQYEISECGDVRRTSTGKRMRGFIDSDGYLRFALCKDCGEKVAVGAHVLVAETFIGPAPSDAHEVAHENGSRFHNHFTNLRWDVSAGNHADRVIHGTSPAGERNPRAKLTADDVASIRREYRQIKQPGSGRKVGELDRQYGICRAQVIRIATGEAWRHVPMPNFHQMER